MFQKNIKQLNLHEQTNYFTDSVYKSFIWYWYWKNFLQ